MSEYGLETKKFVISTLREYGAVPANLLLSWAKRNGYVQADESALVFLSKEGSICYNRKSGIVTLYFGMPEDVRKSASLYAMMHFMNVDETHISPARYPFDFIFEHQERLFQLIDCSDRGRFKLRFRSKMSGDALKGTVPMLLLVNQDYSVIEEYEGGERILPEEDYVIAKVRINPKEKGNMFSVQFFSQEGGCLNWNAPRISAG